MPEQLQAETILQIYNRLFAGETLSLSFSTLGEALKFKNHLAVIKTRQEQMAVGVDLIAEEDRGVLCFEFAQSVLADSEVKMTLSIKKSEELQERKRKYLFTVLDSGLGDREKK